MRLLLLSVFTVFVFTVYWGPVAMAVFNVLLVKYRPGISTTLQFVLNILVFTPLLIPPHSFFDKMLVPWWGAWLFTRPAPRFNYRWAVVAWGVVAVCVGMSRFFFIPKTVFSR